MEDIYSYSDPGQQQPQQQYGPQYPQQQREPNYPAPKKKKKKKKKKTGAVLVSLILVLALLATGGFAYVYKMFSSMNYQPDERQGSALINSDILFQNKNVLNVLVVGVDRRKANEASRSDTMLLVSVDKANKKVRLVSFMRDLWVDIPSKFEAKLNAACTYGGAQLVIDAIEYNFNIKIDKYVLMDFAVFENIIDTLGGVAVPITQKEATAMNRQGKLNIGYGDSVQLNGKEALWYSRIRKLDSDFMRTSRQRKLASAVIEKVKKENPLDLLKLAQDILPQLETDLSPTDLTKLSATAVASYVRYEVEEARIPAEGSYTSQRIKGQDALKPDLGKNQQYLKSFLYENKTPEELKDLW